MDGYNIQVSYCVFAYNKANYTLAVLYSWELIILTNSVYDVLTTYQVSVSAENNNTKYKSPGTYLNQHFATINCDAIYPLPRKTQTFAITPTRSMFKTPSINYKSWKRKFVFIFF